MYAEGSPFIRLVWGGEGKFRGFPMGDVVSGCHCLILYCYVDEGVSGMLKCAGLCSEI